MMIGPISFALTSLKSRITFRSSSTLHGYAAAMVLSGFFNIMQLALPIYSMQVFDRVVPTGHLATLASLMLVMLGLSCCSFAVDVARAILMSRIASRLDKKFYLKSVNLAFEQGVLETSVLPDVAMVRNFVAGPLATAVMDAPWSLIFLIAIFGLHLLLGWMTFIIIIVVVVWAGLGHAITYARRMEALSWSATESAILQSAQTDWQVTQAMGLKHSYLLRFDNAHRMAIRLLSISEGRQAWVDAGARALRNLFQISILTTATFLTIDQQVQAGTIVASSMLFSRALAPIERLSASLPTLCAIHAAMKRVQQLRAFGTKAKFLSLPPISGALTLREVCVTTSKRRVPILSDINFSLPAGAVLVIVGQEGAGKTTLARVLCGALRTTSGQVRFDGTNLLDFRPDELGPQIGFVPESVRLEAGTVASIIARNSLPNDSSVVAAAKMAGAHEMIQQLDQGYQTIVHPDDLGVSAGQRQRLALARALYGNPAIVVLDEPTAHLDDAGEALLVKVVGQLKDRGATVVIVSRLASLSHLADRLIMLENGKIRLDTNQSAVRSFVGVKLAVSRAG